MSGTVLVLMGTFAILLTVSAFLLMRQQKQHERMAARLQAVRNGQSATDKKSIDTRSPVTRIISGFGQVIIRTGALPGKTLTELEQTLTAAGFKGAQGLALFLGAKVIMLVVVPLMVWGLAGWLGYSGMIRILATGIGAVIGLLGPDWTVKILRNHYLGQVESGLPDALDMMVICAEAGLALEPAITRVGKEVRFAHPAVSDEFLLTASELRIVSDHRFALNQMGVRTGLVGLKRLTTTLVQTLQYGTPLTDALRVLSAEMRQEMLTRFEARAARLPVLLTIPMIVFILPCVFLIVGGPAIIQVIKVFKG